MLDGTKNLKVHLENMKKYGVPVMVAINHFNSDSQVEIDALTKWCVDNNYQVSFVDSYLKGSEGAIDFANKVCELLNQKSNYHTLYDYNLSIKEKIEIISKEIYRA